MGPTAGLTVWSRTRERTLSVILAAAEFHAPSLNDFFPKAVAFADTPFALDRLMIIRLAVAGLVALFFALAMRGAKLVPSGMQNVAESMLDFVRINIAEEILGKENGRKFFTLIATIFFATIFLNLTSIIPFLNISSNARIGMPLVMAAVAYVTYVGVGIRKYGFFGFIKSSIVLPGVPMAIQPLLIPIEFVSTFILRPFTLTVRLMANMLSGHIMLVLFFAATQYFLLSGTWHIVFAPFSLIVGVGFTFFELLVIGLQAYIFALLTAVYIDLSLHADQH
ncbi:F0F1 ATP synthase subunit A [Gordonia sp. PP30]|uniref:F0F1 ATP synthase subunit A n=1 Tax=Gordonia sp. PP30 TaxID=2935861 RepID=UPI001FFFAE75|nr:F0F1 ATP synthase subunit A [Gordonia sp. PP30]UQE76984.1 F0F1 ATP synthase subunit A [Gordonia sp. PP30]